MADGVAAPVIPPWASWGKRTGLILPQPEGKGPNGRGLCRWCATEVPKGRSSWCSDDCVSAFRTVWTWEAVSSYVRQRDARCQICGRTHPGWNTTRVVVRVEYVSDRRDWGKRGAPIIERGFKREFCELREWWEVDHILEVINGGTDDPKNLRLLCHRCHVISGVERRRSSKLAASGAQSLFPTAL